MKHKAIVQGMMKGHPEEAVVLQYAETHPQMMDAVVETTAFACMVCKCYTDDHFDRGVAKLRQVVAPHPILGKVALALLEADKEASDEMEASVPSELLVKRRATVEALLREGMR